MRTTLQPRDRELIAELALRVTTALTQERMKSLGATLTKVNDHDVAVSILSAELLRLRADAAIGGSGSLLSDAELMDFALEQVFGLGRLQPYLNDETISDIHVRGCAPVWVKRRDGTREMLDPIVDSDQELVELIRHIATRHTPYERRFDSANPELNLQLNDGSRLFATMEVAQRPSLVIRRHGFDISTLDQLLQLNFMSTSAAAFLSAAVLARRNIVVAGGTGSGKTTLLRALLNEIPANERLVTIEDAYELGIDRFEDLHPDYDALQSRPPNTEGVGEIDLVRLTRMALRMDPDRVIVGEVRGAEAFPMLLAMSQGNNGSMCTIHADSARSVVPKLAAYIALADTGLPAATINMLISSSLHLVVHVENTEWGRRLSSIHEIVDVADSYVVTNSLFKLDDAGNLVVDYPMRHETLELLIRCGFDPRHVGAQKV
ncbi:MAG: CpaF family protein [Actinobacteria bacterium]|nr:CpaF family protein [Actinomycetota bacterium]